jgi:hypothetical protein
MQEEFLKNILNKNIIYIKDKINSIPLIYTNLLEKTITIKKNKFNIVGLMCVLMSGGCLKASHVVWWLVENHN